jgi:hypothetical protein
MTDVQKQIADKIVHYFRNRNGNAVRLQDLEYHLQDTTNGHTLDDIRYMTHILVSKDILHKTERFPLSAGNFIEETFYLGTKGWTYESYDKLTQEEIKERKLQAALIKSSILANKSVKDTNRLQKLILIFTAAASVATLIITYLDYNKESITNVAAPQVRVQLSLPVSNIDTLLQSQPDSQEVQ